MNKKFYLLFFGLIIGVMFVNNSWAWSLTSQPYENFDIDSASGLVKYRPLNNTWLNFDGVDDRVFLGDINQTEFNTNVSFSYITLAKPYLNNPSFALAGKYDGSNRGWIFRNTLSTNHLKVSLFNTSGFGLDLQTSNLINLNKNSLYGFVADGKGSLKVFSNNTIGTNTVINNSFNGGLSASFNIGTRDNQEYFNGTISFARAYNRTLSNDEIRHFNNNYILYNNLQNTSGLMGYWTFNDYYSKDSNTFNYYNSKYEGFTNADVSSVEGKEGRGINFSSSNNYIFLGNITGDLTGLNSFSYFTWIYPFSNQSAISRVISSDFNQQLALMIDTNNLTRCYLKTSSGSSTLISTSKLNMNQWNFIGCVFNGTNHMIFINDTFETITSQTGTVNSSDEPMRVGATSNSFVGLIDEVSFWNTSKSILEVRNIRDNQFSYNTLLRNISSLSQLNNQYRGLVKIENGTNQIFRENSNILFNETGDGSYKFVMTAYNGTYLQNNTYLVWANSSDGLTWNKQGNLIGISVSNASEDPYLVYNGTTYFMFVEDKSIISFQNITLYTSNNFLTWTKIGVILQPTDGEWDSQDVSSPTVYKNGTNWYMFYEGRGSNQAGSIGLATSSDGLTWTKHINNPFVQRTNDDKNWDSNSLVPDDIVNDGDKFYLTYHGEDEYSNFNGVGIINFLNITNKDNYQKLSNPYGRSCEQITKISSNNYISFIGGENTGRLFECKLSFAQLTNESIDYGLITKLLFKENNGTTAFDWSSNKYNGIITGATYGSDGINITTNGYFVNVSLNSIINSLMFWDNGTLINNNFTGNTNLTFYYNQSVYVLDNFNLTEGVTRQYSPLWFSFSTSTEKHIASNLTDTINASVIFNVVSCDNVGTIIYTSNTGTYTQTYTRGSYTCNNNQVELYILGIETASNSNEITIVYDGSIQQICTGSLAGLKQFADMIPLVIIILVSGFLILLLFGQDVDLETMVPILLIAVVVLGIGASIISSIPTTPC